LEVGYFVLFGADFPLLGSFLIITTLVELRLSAFTYVSLLKRPLPVITKDIGMSRHTSPLHSRAMELCAPALPRSFMAVAPP